MRRSAEAERLVGIDWYATDGHPCPSLVKRSPEDFVVEEQLSFPGAVKEPLAGYLPLYRVEKRGVDTMHMARELSEALGSRVSYAGLKDKRAVAVQYVTPTSRRSSRPSQVHGERFNASLVGYVPGPVRRSALTGNRFLIVLRECCSDAPEVIGEAMKAASEGKIPNFYGLQRFGTGGAGTHVVGRAMVRGNFEEAVKKMLTTGRGALGREREAQEAFEAGRYGQIPGLMPEGRDVEIAVARELARHPGDWVKALRAVPVKLRRLYVQAYQSVVFNSTMSMALEAGEDISGLRPGDNWAEASADGLTLSAVRGVRDAPTEAAVPVVQVVGYAFRDYGSRFDSLVKRALEAEGIRAGQFYLEGMQEVSQEGGFRRPQLVVRGGSWSVQRDVASLSFTLPRGQYATVLLREIVKAEDPAGAGLA